MTLHDLRTLVNQSLIRRAENGRYDMHELVRQYAEERLASEPSENGILQTHAQYFADWLDQHSQSFRRTGELQALTTLKPDSENLRMGWQLAVENQKWNLLERMIISMGLFYSLSGRGDEGRTLFTYAAEHFAQMTAENQLPAIATCLWAHCLAWQSDFSSASASAEEIDNLHQKAQTLLNLLPQPVNDAAHHAQAFLLLLRAYRAMNYDLALSERLAKASLEIYSKLDDQPRIADIMSGLYNINFLLYGASADSSQDYLHKALNLRRMLGDQRGIAGELHGLKMIALDMSHFDDAEALSIDALNIFRDSGNQADIATELWTLGLVQVLNGKFAQAAEVLQQSLAIWQELGNRALYATTLNEYCHAKLHLGDYEGTMFDLERSLAITLAIDNKHELSLVYSEIGMLQQAEQKWADSRQSLQRGCEHARGFAVTCLAWNVTLLIFSEIALGNRKIAKEIVLEALILNRTLNYFFLGWLAISGYARLLFDLGQPEKAIALYTLSCNFPYIRNSRWFADVAGNDINQYMTTLPKEIVESAQKRGRTLDYKETVDRLIEELQQITQLAHVDEGSPENGAEILT